MNEQSRLATWADIEAVSRLRMEYLEEAYNGLEPEERERLLNTNIAYLRRQLGQDCFVSLVEVEGEPVSCAYLNLYARAANRHVPRNMYAEIYGVYTRPAYRRQHLATLNMKLLLAAAAEAGAALVQLEASKDGFYVYKELGFVMDENDYVKMKYLL